MVFKLSRISLLRVLRILPVTISELTLETVLARDKVECLNLFSRVTCINENINVLADAIFDHYPGCQRLFMRGFPFRSSLNVNKGIGGNDKHLGND